MPKLSIITVNYNNFAGLQKTMQSVFAQTFTDFEYIIIDGGSTDGSKELIEAHAKSLEFWVSEKDAGVYNAMNKGIAKANGTYLLFLNSGDYLVNDHVFEDVQQIIASTVADVYYCNVNLVTSERNHQLFCYPDQLTLDFWIGNTINHQSAFIRKTLFGEYGFYDEQFKLAADFGLFLKAYCCGKRFYFFNYIMVNYDSTGISTSNYEQLVTERSVIWNMTVPPFVDDLYKSQKKYEKLMQFSIIRYAMKINGTYQRIRNRFRK